MKRLISLLLAIVFVFSISNLAVSAKTSTSGKTNILLNVEPAQISVVAPLDTSFSLSKTGVLTAPKEITIKNLSYAPIRIDSIKVEPIEPWSIVGIENEFANYPIDTKDITFEIDGQDVAEDIDTESYIVNAKDTGDNKLTLELGTPRSLGVQSGDTVSQQVAKIEYVFSFLDLKK